MTHDSRILLAMSRGDEAAARRVWADHSPGMLAHAAAIVGRSAADDVVQGVFLSILRLRAGKVRAVTDPAAWLARLTRRAALNHLRVARRQDARSRPAPVTADAGPVDEDLERALASLDRRDRELLVLKHVAGLTFDQVAVALGRNRSTVASRHRAALASLRLVLGAAAPPLQEPVHAR